MKLRIVAAALTLVLLLAACGTPTQSPAATPTSAPSDGVNVTVHWDALTPKPENIAERWYDEYTDHLIVSDDYGELVPYIGGESNAEYWGSSWFYGLATRDGVIVTDPVYLDVQALTESGSTTLDGRYADALILRTAVELDEPPADEWASKFDDRYGLAAMDGSWYSGQIYTDLVCQSSLGALFFDTDGDAVMLSGDDGSELFRWSAGAIPVDGLAPGQTYWDTAFARGDYMQFAAWGADGNAQYTYVDLRTGELVADTPDVFNTTYTDDGTQRYDGGTYTIADGMITITPDGGEAHSFPVPNGAGENLYPDINGDRVILNFDGKSVLADLDGNELLRIDGLISWLWQECGTTPSLCDTVDYDISDDGVQAWSTYHLYDRDGKLMETFSGTVSQWDDFLVIADDTSYRLTDLQGNDLIRLSRFAELDTPADD